MQHHLTIVGDLGYVEDETRYHLTAQAPGFYGTASVWGQGHEHKCLADALVGFPSTVPSSVEFSFGRCALRFETADGSGRCCVWATVEAEYPSGGSKQFQRASICIWFEPAALDAFCADLRRFETGQENIAVLEGRVP